MGKGDKVSKSKANKPKRVRSTRAEMCKKHEKKRNHYYYERRKVRKQRFKSGLSNDDISVLAKKERELNDKIAVLSSKMFKCGERYQKLLKRKRSLKSKERKLLEKYKVDYSSMLSHQRQEAIRKIQKVSREIEDVEKVIEMPLKDRVKVSKEKKSKSVKSDFEPDDVNDSINEPFGVWELVNVVSDKVRSGLFKYVSIDGEVFNIENQGFEILRFSQRLQDEIDSQRKNESNKISTPRFNMIINLNKKTVKIWQ